MAVPFATAPCSRAVWGSRRELLQFDRCAGLFELRLDLVGLFLGDALLDRLRSRVHEVLRLFEAEARHRTDDLDHLNLLAACPGEDDVEGGLLLRRGSVAAGCSAGGRDRDRSGSGD